MTIDKFINSEGDEVDIGVEDSIWNFHVWNEAWFKRKDLPKGTHIISCDIHVAIAKIHQGNCIDASSFVKYFMEID